MIPLIGTQSILNLKPPSMNPPRPEVLQGTTYTRLTGSGKVYVTINSLNGNPIEVFAFLGHCGSEERALTEAIGRLCSLALRSGVSLIKLRKQLRGISSEKTFGLGPSKVMSVPDAIGQSLEEFYENHT